MRRIYKTEILSSYYQNWIEQEKYKDKHPSYSPNNVHYFDLRMSLLYCQKGLCAYTEEKLCKPQWIEKSKWKDGKYSETKENVPTRGAVEHFDSTLKDKKGWLWDNLLMVGSDINNHKGTKEVKYILKPDSSNYDEYKYLQFDYETDTFYPNIHLIEDERRDVEYMIQTLGLNRVQRREDMIQNLKIDFEHGMELEEPNEYITAWNMTLSQLQVANKQ